MDCIDLTPRLRAAAEYMESHGWAQNEERDANGAVCLTGAIRNCSPQDGDFYLIRGVLRSNNRGEVWNDAPGRTQADVLAVLRTVTITDRDLEQAYGPQWSEIVSMVRHAVAMTGEQAAALLSAYRARPDHARHVACSMVRDIAREAGRYVGVVAAKETVRSAAFDAVWHANVRKAVWGAAGNASMALAVKDLISAEDFGTLYGPWGTVFGAPSGCLTGGGS